MPTNFPTSVDNFTNPTANDSLNLPSHSTQHANANDAIEAVETYLLNGAGKTGMKLLSTTSLSGASVTISITDQTFNSLEIWIQGCTNATSAGSLRVAPNAATNLFRATGTASIDTNSLRDLNANYIQTSFSIANADPNNFARIVISNYASTANYKATTATFGFTSSASFLSAENYSGVLRTNSAITSLVISNSGGNLSTGTVKVWGI